MATQDERFANQDLKDLSVNLSKLKLAMSVAPSRRAQKRKRSGTQTSTTATTDTKDVIIEQIKEDMRKIVGSPLAQAATEYSNWRLPASKSSRQLYKKLGEIRESDAGCTEEDIDQVTSLLKTFIREIDPDHPYVAETEESLAKGMMLLDRSLDKGDDDEAGDSDYQDEPMGDDNDDDYEEEL
ncbi:hypothetical protein FGADI_9292 [Fusarium gaditjirri]|uniref:Uncharacterized protein n=1 Tax=Fusarium gaditjirri TaxID=282569 RepID=A0A8H4WSU5_9HYPO|nr:hypothetical protein FGADI_9292 [Fusarium gaditjirri]